MEKAPLLLSIILIIFGIVTVYLSSWALFKKNVNGSVEFSIFMLSISIYIFGYALEITRTDIASILDAVKMEYTGIPYVSFFLLLFVYKFIKKRSMKLGFILGLLIIPVISTILVYTMPHHNLFYINPKVEYGDFFPVLTFGKGPIYIIRFIYQQLLSLFVVVLLFIHLKNVSGREKAQIISMLVGILIPFIIVLFYVIGLIPDDIDINPFSAAIMGVIFTFSIFKFGLFELVPKARDIAVDSIDEAFIVLDKSLVVQDMNNAILILSHIIKPEIGKKLPENSELTEKILNALKSNESNFDYTFSRINNINNHYQIKMYQVCKNINSFEGVAILVTDVTKMKDLMNKLEHQATYDVLTNIYNRRYMMEVGKREIEVSKRNGTPLGIIMVDIDHFKKINDTYGHHTGDLVLQQTAKSLTFGLRKVDIAGRYGGEEFLIICPVENSNDTLVVAERLRSLVAKSEIKVDNITIKVTASFGVHTLCVDSPLYDLDLLIEKADHALYMAKESGRNKVSFIE